ncbi:hypothetical protein BU16DRAFT_597860 [Lophium mytilinum]|uniref:Uncharacterized protein n=1 Tax=Lophium mytilinum TaxID=390894 RepID=A0A6A6QC93_9PEZI|nr:hypothetical protein BU16DRAFT_597860 [Lophium mytilinum]
MSPSLPVSIRRGKCGESMPMIYLGEATRSDTTISTIKHLSDLFTKTSLWFTFSVVIAGFVRSFYGLAVIELTFLSLIGLILVTYFWTLLFFAFAQVDIPLFDFDDLSKPAHGSDEMIANCGKTTAFANIYSIYKIEDWHQLVVLFAVTVAPIFLLGIIRVEWNILFHFPGTTNRFMKKWLKKWERLQDWVTLVAFGYAIYAAVDSAVRLSNFRSRVKEIKGYHPAAEEWGYGQTTALLVWLPILVSLLPPLVKALRETCRVYVRKRDDTPAGAEEQQPLHRLIIDFHRTGILEDQNTPLEFRTILPGYVSRKPHETHILVRMQYSENNADRHSVHEEANHHSLSETPAPHQSRCLRLLSVTMKAPPSLTAGDEEQQLSRTVVFSLRTDDAGFKLDFENPPESRPSTRDPVSHEAAPGTSHEAHQSPPISQLPSKVIADGRSVREKPNQPSVPNAPAPVSLTLSPTLLGHREETGTQCEWTVALRSLPPTCQVGRLMLHVTSAIECVCGKALWNGELDA